MLYKNIVLFQGTYNANTGRLISETMDIRCTDRYGFCSEAEWSNSAWRQGNIPDQNSNPAIKDTIVVPTGLSKTMLHYKSLSKK